jgi:hypothetical protein
MAEPRKRFKYGDRQRVATHGNRFGAHGKEGSLLKPNFLVCRAFTAWASSAFVLLTTTKSHQGRTRSQPNGARWPSILERAANETGHALTAISQRPHDETYLTFA